MPIQYPDMPQFQAPNLNLMGAYAQGAALQQQQLQEERTRQQMELAGIKDIREAELAQSRLYGQQFDNLAKMRSQFREDMATVHSQADTDRIFSKYEPIAGAILPQDRTFSEENKRRWLMGTEQYLKATEPTERDAVGPDGRIIKETGYVNPYTGQFVRLNERAAPQEWVEEKNKAGNIIGYRSKTGTQRLTPEQFDALGTPAAAPAAAPTDVYNNVPMAQIKQGFSRVESGSPEGNYAALGPTLKSGDRAYGKYQVMGANIPSWTKQALGRSMTPEEFLASPEAQEKVFENQFQRNFKKYGTVEDAASVWFSGRPLAQATKAGARDINMGVPEYVQKVVGGMEPVRNVPTAPLTGVNPSLRALTEQPVNAMVAPLPPVNAMAAPVQMPQAVTAPAPTPMAQPAAPMAQPAAPVVAASAKFEPLTPDYPGVKKFSVGTEKQVAQDTAINMLNKVGFDVKTGTDEVEKNLAKASKSGPDYLKASWNDFNGRPSDESQANATLDSLAEQVSIGLAGGSLGAGVSVADKAAFDKAAGDLGAWYKSPKTRLAAWRTIKEILSRTNGIPYERPSENKPAPIEDRAQPRGVAGESTAKRSIVAKGTYNERPVVKYSDGTIEYAD